MASQSSNWRHPSQADMAKFGLNPVPEDFEPTKEEQMLLDMYETVKAYEREAARLRDETNRAKLAAREAEFQQKIAPVPNKRKRQPKGQGETARESALDGEEEDEDIHEEEEEDEQEQTLRERREAKIAALRAEVQEAKFAAENKEEDNLREKLLATKEIELEGGRLLKKKKTEAVEQNPSSLIANLTAASTQPHDFSRKLELTRGKTLFPRSPEETKWTPPEAGVAVHPNEHAFIVELNDFDVTRAHNGQGNNTIAIKFTAPSESKRFSINIAGPNHNEFDSVLFHFNPRHHERGGQVIINDKKDGVWGQAIAIPLSQIPVIFGQISCTLLIQITGDGFDIFLEDRHCARLEHRSEIPSGNQTLYLQFPSTDDYGSPENWTVYKVWWGVKPLMAKGDLSSIAGVNSFDSMHPRKLFISGLSRIFSEAEVDIRRAELERAFRKYGGDRGVQVVVPTNVTYAFVEMESERQCDLALREMSTKYRLNRARRTRHEALQEERAATEAATRGEKKEVTDWD